MGEIAVDADALVARAHLGWSINVLRLRGERIAEITSFIGPDHFGLPALVP